MKVFYISQDCKSTEITSLCSSIEWSGDVQQAARKVEMEIVDSAYDNNIPHVDITPGSRIILIDKEDREIFQGFVFMREKDFGSQTTKILCYDGMIYLTKSKASYNFRDTTAEQMTGKICKDFGIPVGTLMATGIKQSRIFISKTPYEIITEAYGEASKQSKKMYVAVMKEGKLFIDQKGSQKVDYLLDPGANILSSRYSESIENMINTVKVYDDKGNFVTKRQNDDWVKLYGILQEAYQKESGKDPVTVADNMLKGMERNGEIEALGNIKCISGNAIEVKECYSGIKGLFYISSDNHSWKDGLYTMRLTLDFDKVYPGKGDGRNENK
ncbi:MAG: XkdQ/YqbQ family protein [Bacillota bacterium]